MLLINETLEELTALHSATLSVLIALEQLEENIAKLLGVMNSDET